MNNEIQQLSAKERVADYKNLLKATKECKCGIMWKDSAAGFYYNRLRNCARLHDEILNDKYKLSPYIVFELYEPKRRTISSTRIRDRVVQRVMCNEGGYYKDLTEGFIYDNGACIRGKGTDFSRRRLETLLKRYIQTNGTKGYVLKIDLHDFYGSTPHTTAIKAAEKRLKDKWITAEMTRIINSFNNGADPNKGVGLGSQVIQVLQLAVLDDIDHYIKEVMRIKCYQRYMDDFIIVHPDLEHIKACYNGIKQRLEEMGLTFNPTKTVIQPLVNVPIRYLGYNYTVLNTGRLFIKITHQKITKERKRIRTQAELVRQGRMTLRRFHLNYRVWRNSLNFGNNYKVRLKMDAYFKEVRDFLTIEIDRGNQYVKELADGRRRETYRP